MATTNNAAGRYGAMYRPVTEQTRDKIRQFMDDYQLSWNAAVNTLVLLGLESNDKRRARKGGAR